MVFMLQLPQRACAGTLLQALEASLYCSSLSWAAARLRWQLRLISLLRRLSSSSYWVSCSNSFSCGSNQESQHMVELGCTCGCIEAVRSAG